MQQLHLVTKLKIEKNRRCSNAKVMNHEQVLLPGTKALAHLGSQAVGENGTVRLNTVYHAGPVAASNQNKYSATASVLTIPPREFRLSRLAESEESKDPPVKRVSIFAGGTVQFRSALDK